MHHICEVLDWPSVHDLYPFVGMRAERRTKRKSPAKPRTAKSLAAPANAAQGTCTLLFPVGFLGRCGFGQQTKHKPRGDWVHYVGRPLPGFFVLAVSPSKERRS